MGHALWLIGISMATGSASRSTAVLVVSVMFLLFAAAMAYLAWQRYQLKELTWAAFLAGLSFSPVVFTIIVLGVTYL